MLNQDGGQEDGDAARAREVAEIERFVQAVVQRSESRASSGSEPESLETLLPLAYAELRLLASYLLRGEKWARTLQPTALAHEAYLRLARETRSELKGREHLLAVAATAMRRVLIDHARARRAAKRGGGVVPVSLRESLLDDAGAPVDLLDLHRALERLESAHPRKVRVVELLYFAGLTHEEAGAALEINERTVLRDWRFAKAWLWKELSGSGGTRSTEATP